MSKPRLRISENDKTDTLSDGTDQSDELPALLELPEEFTVSALKDVHQRISKLYQQGLFAGIDGRQVRRTDGAGVQLLVACRLSHASTGAAGSLVLLTSDRLSSAIETMGAGKLLIDTTEPESTTQTMAA